MGFFSWRTNDSHKSIASRYSSRKPITVFMKDDKGNTWKEDNYEGYGTFGGKDFYELLAEMNGFSEKDLDGREVSNPMDYNELRNIGIDITYNITKLGLDPKEVKWPALFEGDQEWYNARPRDCEYQGFFY